MVGHVDVVQDGRNKTLVVIGASKASGLLVKVKSGKTWGVEQKYLSPISKSYKFY